MPVLFRWSVQILQLSRVPSVQCMDWCGNSTEGSNLFVSGSHDSLVKMWDIRYTNINTGITVYQVVMAQWLARRLASREVPGSEVVRVCFFSLSLPTK